MSTAGPEKNRMVAAHLPSRAALRQRAASHPLELTV